MKTYWLIIIFLVITLSAFSQSRDWRLINNGTPIYDHGYCDQPYIVVTSDGTWVCTFTTSPEHEGNATQYIVSTYSRDQGKTWSEPVPIESPSGPEASWAIPLITSFDRIYVFYTYNGNEIRTLPNGDPMRADTHGWYCYKYSDDHGKTWSKRYRLDMRKTAADRQNDFNGKVQMFWGIGKPVTKNNNAWFSFTKLGKYFLKQSEGWLYHSPNILTEKDVDQIKWEMLPEGDHGIRNPGLGSVQEEHNIQPLNQENGLVCVYRTTRGQPAISYSYDNGHSWTNPKLINYANGNPLRNPRACPRLWKCENGKYLLWYHNNGNDDFRFRNPAWIAGGIEKNGKIQWSQPEIMLYSHDLSYSTGRLSYPDLVEQNGRYWVSTTQKTTATLHEIPASFLESLWGQFDEPEISRDNIINKFNKVKPGKYQLEKDLSMQDGGFTLDFWVNFDEFKDTVLIENKTGLLQPMNLSLQENGSLKFSISNGPIQGQLVAGEARLKKDKWHHIALIVDHGPGIISMLIDGQICDGNGKKIFGYTWYDKRLDNFSIRNFTVNKFPGKIKNFRVYGKNMLISDMAGNFKAGMIK